MKLPVFDYRRATSVGEALLWLQEGSDETMLLAGGQSLIAAMAFRRINPTSLIDINRVGGLDHIEESADGLVIGALVRYAALEQAGRLAGAWAALPEAARYVGNYAVRSRGTLGGSIAQADPSAELCVAAVALDAHIQLRSRGATRQVAATDFFLAPQTTLRAPAEIVMGIRFATPPPNALSTFEEFRERSGGLAWASVCAGLAIHDGRISWARVGLGSVAPVPMRAMCAEAMLTGSMASAQVLAEAARVAASECAPQPDSHTNGEHRRQLVAVVVRRALERLLRRAEETTS